MSGFAICGGKGFHMTFANGWTASVQFGSTNYIQGYPNNLPGHCESPDAEIAAWDTEGNWHDFDGRGVKGWVSPDDVLAFLQLIAAKKSGED